MIKIRIPNNNVNERKYIAEVIFDEFLGLEYEIECTSGVYEIIIENGNKLIIEDHFFNKSVDDLDYLKLKYIPKNIEFIQNEFTIENNIPCIYGSPSMEISNSTITCALDIFASTFFMLTRWEEYVIDIRDKHNRFPAHESLAYKQGFLDRPVVNEYVEMLWNMLKHLKISQTRKTRNFNIIVTHDVDVPLKYRRIHNGIKEIIGDFVKRKKFKKALKSLLQKIQVHIKIIKDPYDTFSYLMKASEAANIKSYFFFMAKGKSKFDNYYKSSDKFVKKLIKEIKNRDHHIGFHPTYDAYNNPKQFAKEKSELEDNFSTKISAGRQHFLRFEIPTTWQIWENNGMDWDCTLSFADKEGFRCGVCYEFSVFNILTRMKLHLKEKPLIVMEKSFITYQSNINPIDMANKIRALYNKTLKYKGDFVFLWHNNSFNSPFWNKFQFIFEEILGKNYENYFEPEKD